MRLNICDIDWTFCFRVESGDAVATAGQEEAKVPNNSQISDRGPSPVQKWVIQPAS